MKDNRSGIHNGAVYFFAARVGPVKRITFVTLFVMNHEVRMDSSVYIKDHCSTRSRFFPLGFRSNIYWR